MATITQDPSLNDGIESKSVQKIHHDNAGYSFQNLYLCCVARNPEDDFGEDYGNKNGTGSISKSHHDLGHPTAGPELFEPQFVEYCDGNRKTEEYRFFCPHAGQFKCNLTSIVFEMKDKGEVLYRTVNWDDKLLKNLPKMEPAGLLYNIECPEDSIRRLHLPHCEIGKDRDKLTVAHVTGDNTEIMKPLTVTNSHVAVNIQSLSGFGLTVPFKGSSVKAQVLLFYKKHTEQTNKLHIHLLPANISVRDVQKEHESYTYIETVSNCELLNGKKYRLSCKSTDREYQPNPEIVKFIRDYGSNFHPSFEVILYNNDTKVEVTLFSQKGKEVWSSPNIFLPRTGTERNSLSLPTTGFECFADKHREQLIQRVSTVMEIADGLKSKNMISPEMYNKIHVEPLRINQMRLLYEVLESGGGAVKAEFYKILKEKHPALVDDLEAGSSQA
ncbi:NACHT, LRR and PYD domains-containing protein 1b allele 2-like isoform X2 [Silurus meridionalis]|uniref:NACHT, LRR and PYD domains-containing protein 1b allele 2-like isoform X2 n=1 Tax=Silurus meridionalis TaxID=175797 RepID=UPI001EECE184|nr:NACHT, LRR and PYD domains-containing protein 1b allele 2-like isoform X2 [Silurus meridionalis]